MVWIMDHYWSSEKWTIILLIRCHWLNEPFDNPTHVGDLNTRLLRYSDPYCISPLLIMLKKKTCNFSGWAWRGGARLPIFGWQRIRMLGNNFSKTSQREEGERDPSLVGQDRDCVRRRRHQRLGTQQHRIVQVRSKIPERDHQPLTILVENIIHRQCPIQWGSEIRTCPDFEWWRVGQFANGIWKPTIGV